MTILYKDGKPLDAEQFIAGSNDWPQGVGGSVDLSPDDPENKPVVFNRDDDQIFVYDGDWILPEPGVEGRYFVIRKHQVNERMEVKE
jgi:hypothetical protein